MKKRWKVLAVVGALGTIGAALVAPGAIAADYVNSSALLPPVYDPFGPTPVSIKPSHVVAATTTADAAIAQTFRAGMLYKHLVSPEVFGAYRVQQSSGPVTPAQQELINQRAAEYRVPGTRLQTLTKVVGGAASAVSLYSVGTWFGNDVVETIIGHEAADSVCRVDGLTGTFLQIASGRDCSTAGIPFAPEFVPNLDATETGAWSDMCGLAGISPIVVCFSFLGSTVLSNGSHRYCFFPTPADDQFLGAGVTIQRQQSSNGVWANTTWFGASSGASGSTVCGGTIAPNTTYPYVQLGAAQSEPLAFRMFDNSIGSFSEPSQPQVADPDPVRQARCTITIANNGDPNDPVDFSGAPLNYQETDPFMPTPVCPLVDGSTVLSIAYESAVTGEPWLEYFREDMLPETRQLLDTQPECMDGSCLLELDRTGPNQDTVNCFDNPASCRGWYEDAAQNPDLYNCTFGGVATSIAECYIYRDSFDPGSRASGNWLTDPVTGQPAQAPPGTQRGTDINTGTGTGTGMGAPAQDPAQDRQCFPSGWSALNPVEWVLRPVQCALEWAFVPRTESVIAAGTRVTTAAEGTSITQARQVIQSIPTWFPSLDSDCRGPAVTFGPPLDDLGIAGTFYPLDACEAPMSTFATVARIALTVTIGFFVALAIVRYLAATIGFVGAGAPKGEGG